MVHSAQDTEHHSLGISDSRVAVYLLFTAEVSLFAAMMGAYVVLRLSDTALLPFVSRSESRVAYLAGACLLLHVVLGAALQRQNANLFWKLTALLCASVALPLVILR